MSDYFTTEELADFLRIKSRKVYDLVSKDLVPHSRVMGKLLFSKIEISNWISGNKSENIQLKSMPIVLLGSHDPLLELAVKKSKSGIAMSFDGSTQGLERFKLNEGFVSGLHLYDNDENIWNVPIVKKQLSDKAVVLIEWAKRERGLIFKENNNIKNISIENYKGKRLVRRQIGSGSEIYLQYILRTYNLSHDDFKRTEIAYSENDAVHLVLSDKADVTLGLKSEAKKYQLGFCPIITERFDLVVDRKFWFEKPFQDLLNFCKTSDFKEIASNLDGYNIIDLGKVHFNSN
ncbi:helix-turn-helix transcriptional regulator [Alphaproteobacteria bacterium]|jgi:putative molybdopterin biosynthesis protein|nr:helix-turn-helix transcriptional regulator [Alphaproteobacteria bacterium]